VTPVPPDRHRGVSRAVLIRILIYVVGLAGVLTILDANTNAVTFVSRLLGWRLEDPNSVMQGRIRLVVRMDSDVPESSAVILGDSIMAALDSTAIGPKVSNLAVNGLTSAALSGAVTDLHSLSGARAIVLGIGVNDLRDRTHDEVIHDYSTLVARLPGSPALLTVAVLPVNEDAPFVQNRPFLRNAEIDALNDGIRKICARRPRCVFIPTKPFLADGSGNLRGDIHSGDGWHLAPIGSAKLAAAIREVLEQVSSPARL